jgi:hypothetical protein
MKPDFLGIGAQKSGTSWLARNLEAHPAISMPPVKEIHFFDRPPGWRDPVRRYLDSEEDSGRSRGTAWDRRYDRHPRDEDWYLSLFEPDRGQISGEITPGYAPLNAEAVGRVRALLPEIRILYFLRNPIERTWSQTLMYLDRYGMSLRETTSRRLRELFFLERVRRLSDYLGALDRWSAAYLPERIFVGFLEDVAHRPRELLAAVYEFLEVDPGFRSPHAETTLYSHARDRIPTAAARAIATADADQVRGLDARFGGYASFWRLCVDRLLGDELGDERALPFPLWRSSLWRDWLERSGGEAPALRSGPLSELGS